MSWRLNSLPAGTAFLTCLWGRCKHRWAFVANSIEYRGTNVFFFPPVFWKGLMKSRGLVSLWVMLALAEATQSRSADSFSLLIRIATSWDPLVTTKMDFKNWFCTVTVFTDSNIEKKAGCLQEKTQRANLTPLLSRRVKHNAKLFLFTLYINFRMPVVVVVLCVTGFHFKIQFFCLFV